jgi:hypothetical protein
MKRIFLKGVFGPGGKTTIRPNQRSIKSEINFYVNTHGDRFSSEGCRFKSPGPHRGHRLLIQTAAGGH